MQRNIKRVHTSATLAKRCLHVTLKALSSSSRRLPLSLFFACLQHLSGDPRWSIIRTKSAITEISGFVGLSSATSPAPSTQQSSPWPPRRTTTGGFISALYLFLPFLMFASHVYIRQGFLSVPKFHVHGYIYSLCLCVCETVLFSNGLDKYIWSNGKQSS